MIEEGLQPLAKFQVILILGSDELVHIDMPLDAIFCECSLQKLVVADEFIVRSSYGSRMGDWLGLAMLLHSSLEQK